MLPTPFTIEVSDEKLSWINDRVESAYIIPDVQHPKGQEWADGPPTATIQDIVEYWKTSYDWRQVEARLNNTFKMFTADVEEDGQILNVHFVHHTSTRPDAIPLIFVHGWPGSFLEVEHLLGLLTEPEDQNAQAFHVVAPSIPGFTFSSAPEKSGFTIVNVASLFNKLMVNVLGYQTFMAQGGDWGAGIIRTLASNHSSHCIAAHTNLPQAFGPPSPLKNPLTFFWIVTGWFTSSEKARMAHMQNWFKNEFGYAWIQGTKPQTVSYALMDSPVGLLAWIYDKTHALVDPSFVWEKEAIINWTMMYLLSGSAGHARIYKDNMDGAAREVKVIGKEVAFGSSAFKYDVAFIPRWWAQSVIATNITLWREHDHGGHFPGLECPEILSKDLQDFVESMPAGHQKRLKVFV